LRRDLGDFQTPPELVAAVLEAIGPVGRRWPRVLEPTCGRGHFIAGLLAEAAPPREIRGIEVQQGHCESARQTTQSTAATEVAILETDLFQLDLRTDLNWRGDGPLLVIGNPPWVTNAELGVLGGGILPAKSNVKKLRGIAAKTGSSNFDITEAVWLKLINELAHEPATIALLCKTSVARGVLEFAERAGLPIAEAAIFSIDARRWFKVVVEACLFRVTLGRTGFPERIPVYDDLNGTTAPRTQIGFDRGRIIADSETYHALRFADGDCPFTWRQGLKHDAAAVMELTRDETTFSLRNKLGEAVDIEPSWVYPLVKGSDLVPGLTRRPSRAVIVTQHRIGQETRMLEYEAPKLWAYLESNAFAFAKRKSSIYKRQPRFALFGVGPYSFAPYKVAISGLHKEPCFRALGPRYGRPVMLDDTSYFLPCRTAEQAAMTSALLNDPATLGLLRAITFRDAKRPITKSVLQRLDLNALAARVDHATLVDRAEEELARLHTCWSDEPHDPPAERETESLEPAGPPSTSQAM